MKRPEEFSVSTLLEFFDSGSISVEQLNHLVRQLRTAEQEGDTYLSALGDIADIVEADFGENTFDAINKTVEAVKSLRAQLKAALEGKTIDGNPTELEMHRADYNAIKAAGFESPGELLAAYKVLDDKIKIAHKQKPIGYADPEDIKELKRYDYWRLFVNNKANRGATDVPLYIAPIPVQQSPAVAVPEYVIAETINKIRDVAIKYHGAQQLREQIAAVIRPLLKPSPRIT